MGGWARGKRRTMASQLQVRLADTCSFGTIFLGLDVVLLQWMISKFNVDLDMSRHEAGRPDAQAAGSPGHLLRLLQAMFRIGFSLICIACILFVSCVCFWLF